MKRGEVWWADFGDPRGSAPALRRPVLIVQDDVLTESALRTVMVVPLTCSLSPRARKSVDAGLKLALALG